MISYDFLWCDTCQDKTVHCKPPSEATAYFCMRHAQQTLKPYFEQRSRTAEAIMAAQEYVKDFPAWSAVRNKN